MGEVWSAPATWQVEESSAQRVKLRLEVMTPITPARFSKTLTLESGSPTLQVEYRIEHLGGSPFDYIWGVHPSLAITLAHRFDVPATQGEADERDVLGDLLGIPGELYEWPVLRGNDLRAARAPSEGAAGLHYLTGLTEGWVASTDTGLKRGFGLVFDLDTFSCVWLVLGYGGFRGFYQALLEPWTGYPTRLEEATAAGRARTLHEGQSVEASVAAVIYGGVTKVGGLGADGSVREA